MDNDEESDDEIEVTAKEVFEKLVEAWLNEKFSPDILETKIQLVQCMLAQVKELENEKDNSDKDIASSLQKVELERVKFVISSYLRERLRKIEVNTVHILNQEAKSDNPKLSPAELVYAKGFADHVFSHMDTVALQDMPANMQTIDKKKNVPRPNLDEYVFAKVIEDEEQVLVDPDEDPIDFKENDQRILRFRPVASLIEKGSVSLI